MPDAPVAPVPEIRELTEGEIANGWTKETLAAYLEERRAQKIAYLTRAKPRQVVVQNFDGFSPFRW